MKKDYLDLTLLEFLDVITGKEITYELKTERHSLFKGTLSDFNYLVKATRKDNQDFSEYLKSKVSDKKKYIYEASLTNAEIYRYLKSKTDNFDLDMTRLILRDIELYNESDFKERIGNESVKIYKENGWDIPREEIKNRYNNEIIAITDYAHMLRKTHPFSGFEITFAMQTLRMKLKFHSEIDSNIPIFQTVFREDQLSTIYTRSKNLIKCSKSDFMFWFFGTGENAKQIKWILFHGEVPNKAALYYYCRKMNPKVTPGIIKRVFFNGNVRKNNDTGNHFSSIDNIFKNI